MTNYLRCKTGSVRKRNGNFRGISKIIGYRLDVKLYTGRAENPNFTNSIIKTSVLSNTYSRRGKRSKPEFSEFFVWVRSLKIWAQGTKHKF